ncbi:MAG: glycosyltransferase family 2 protein [Desulfurococcaceae archaeon]
MTRNIIVDGLMSAILLGLLAYSTLISLGIASYFFYKPKRGSKRAENIEIVVVSKADHKVKNSLLEVVKYHINKYGKITVVVDEDAPLTGLLRKTRGARLVEVPAGYRKDLIGKGRALQYFVDYFVERGKWYAFIDDDNLIIDDSFLYEIPKYEENGYVASNGILVPRPGRSTIAYVMDWIRYMDDLLLYRFFTGSLKRPLLGLHGDLIIVKGDVLKEIGFHRRTLTEDFEFAAELVRRGYKTWQSATRVSIKSPSSIKDLVLQRGRWFKGIVEGIRRCPLKMKLTVILRSFTFGIGFLLLMILAPIVSYIGLVWFVIPGGIYYMSTYTYGIYKARKLYLILLLPLFGLIEATSRVYGLLNVNEYVVIDKN